MKHCLINFLLLALFVHALHAQQVSGQASFGSFAQSFVSLSDQARFSVISDFTGTGRAGSNTHVLQTGNQNTLNLHLAGNGNNISTKQNGDLNTLNMELKGTNSQYLLSQDGNDNKLYMNHVVSSGINFQASQLDGGNSLTLEGGGFSPLQSMKVEQSGGMKIIIDSNPLIARP